MTRALSSVEEQAVLWHERLLRDKVPKETRAAFEMWLQASPNHRRAYTRAQQSWDALQHMAESAPILALRHEAVLRLSRRTAHRLSPLRAAAAVVLMFAVGLGALIRFEPSALPEPLTGWVRGWLPGQSHYATATGERLAATLKDGSQVTLDTQSELEVAFTKAERLVRLKRGQAFFEVAKDKAHPFVVEVNDRRLVAVGTAFDVRVDEGQLRVTMVEGTVRVEPVRTSSSTAAPMNYPGASGSASGAHPKAGADSSPHSAAPSPQVEGQTLITAGEQLWVDHENEDHVRRADTERATSWRRGQLIFDGVRLADAIAEVNRYSDIKVQLGDAELADVRISGAFATGRSEVFVEAVTSYFPIAQVPSSDGAVVLKARR